MDYIAQTNNPIVEGHSQKAAIFATLPMDTALLNVRECIYRPTNAITSDSSCVEFSVNSNGRYLDLGTARLFMEFRILHQDGTVLGKYENVAPANLPVSTMFGQIDVILSHTAVNNLPTPLHSYKSYLDKILGYGEEAKDGWLTAEMFARDTPGLVDQCKRYKDDEGALEEDSVGTNEGFIVRMEMVKGSRVCQVEGPMDIDVFKTNRYTVGNVPLTLRLWPNNNAFRLMGSDTTKSYKVEMLDVQLKIDCIELCPQVVIAHEATLAHSNAIYPYMQSQMRVFNIGVQQVNFVTDNVFGSGTLPSKVFVCFVSAHAYNGQLGLSPFNFQSYNINKICYTVNSEARPAGRGLYPNFDTGNYIESYVGLMRALGHYGKNRGCGLSLNEWGNGFTVFGWDLDSHHSTEYLPVPRRGNSGIEVTFSKPLPSSVNMIVYGKFSEAMVIDQSRRVKL